MKLSQFTRRAQDALEQRGGIEALRQDAQEAREAASGHDSLVDKARAAADAFKQPGRDRDAEHAAGGAAHTTRR